MTVGKQDTFATTTKELAEASQALMITEDKPTFVIPKMAEKNRHKFKVQVFFLLHRYFSRIGRCVWKNMGKGRSRQMIKSLGGI